MVQPRKLSFDDLVRLAAQRDDRRRDAPGELPAQEGRDLLGHDLPGRLDQMLDPLPCRDPPDVQDERRFRGNSKPFTQISVGALERLRKAVAADANLLRLHAARDYI